MCNAFKNFMGYDDDSKKSALDGMIGMMDVADNFFSESEALINKLNKYANKKTTSNAKDEQDQDTTGEKSSCKSKTCGCVSKEASERKRRETEEDSFEQTRFLYETAVVIRKRLEEAIEDNDDFPEETFVTISLVKNEAHIRTEVRDDAGESYQTKALNDWLCEPFFDEAARFGGMIRSGVSSDEFGPYFYIQKVYSDGGKY
jgi:hypothetical protein